MAKPIEALRAIFSKVCTDFQAQLVELDGMLVNYPPKVSVSSLVNSLKGVSSYVLRRRLPRIAKCYSRRMFCGRLLISPHPVAAHHSTSSSATLNSRPHRYSRLKHSILPWPWACAVTNALIARSGLFSNVVQGQSFMPTGAPT